MTEVPICMLRKWYHSFEEDTNGTTVYRPENFRFPPTRGRKGIEFKPDGTFVDFKIGQGDARERVLGRWQTEMSGCLLVSFTGKQPSRHLEILECNTNVLRIRWNSVLP